MIKEFDPNKRLSAFGLREKWKATGQKRSRACNKCPVIVLSISFIIIIIFFFSGRVVLLLFFRVVGIFSSRGNLVTIFKSTQVLRLIQKNMRKFGNLSLTLKVKAEAYPGNLITMGIKNT